MMRIGTPKPDVASGHQQAVPGHPNPHRRAVLLDLEHQEVSGNGQSFYRLTGFRQHRQERRRRTGC